MENGEQIEMEQLQGRTAYNEKELCAREGIGPLKSGLEGIMYGFVFLFIDVNLGRLNIFPDWVGYLLFRESFDRLGNYEPDVLLLKPLATLLAVYDAARWLALLLGFSHTIMAVEVVATVAVLYFCYQLLTDLGNLAVRCGVPSGTWFYRLRVLQAAMTTLLMLFRVVFIGPESPWLLWSVTGLSMVSGICVLLAVHALHRALKEV